MSDITGLKYPTVAGVIRSIYLKSKFLVRTEDKKYGHIDPEQVQEKTAVSICQMLENRSRKSPAVSLR